MAIVVGPRTLTLLTAILVATTLGLIMAADFRLGGDYRHAFVQQVGPTILDAVEQSLSAKIEKMKLGVKAEVLAAVAEKADQNK
ncbi:hypothetical protein QBK93_36910 [Rhizobium leguminosarum]|uniref:hypothetical protein n=1 Tax=Rhizobium leguminosarum TaxID=384 RepID=UPI0024A97E68|nr:hypothetical protein [Rhizobium leguminosarum]MDI5930166.1 hypothetical protein [Rhizobium leguminosarum]